MKKSISKYDFGQAFIDMGRENNFSYAGRNALFDYLEEYEETTGEGMELDVIAFCCEFTEYKNIEEFISAYNDIYVVWETEPAEADEEEGTEATEGEIDYEATLDKIREATDVIDIDGESFIIRDF